MLKNSANNSIFASILDSRSSNSTTILQFSDSASTRLRLQSFDIRLDDEPRVWTPLCQYLTLCYHYQYFRFIAKLLPFFILMPLKFSAQMQRSTLNVSPLVKTQTRLVKIFYLLKHLRMERALKQVQHPELFSRPGKGWHCEVILEQNHLSISSIHPVA